MNRPKLRWDARLLLWLAVAGVLFFAAPSAFADQGSGVGVMSTFDVTDSHGIRVSQYELSIDMGHPVTSPLKYSLGTFIQFTWSCYQWWVGLLAWLLDFIVGFGWATPVIGGLDEASSRIRSDILTPLGADSPGGSLIAVLFLGAALVAVIKAPKTGIAKTAMNIAAAVLAIALSLGVLAAPVKTLAGTHSGMAMPLVAARNFGLQISIAAQGIDVPAAMPGGKTLGQVPTGAAMGPALVSAMVRPVHQALNYGRSLGGDPCEPTYDETLKAGPYGLESSTARDALGACNEDLKNYAESTAFFWAVLVGFFNLTGLLLGLLIGCFVVIVALAVLGFAWSAFKLPYVALVAVVAPARGWSDLARAAIDMAFTTLYLAMTIAATGLFVMLISKGLTANTLPIPVRFVVADLMLIAAAVALVMMWRAKRRHSRTVGEKVAQAPPLPSPRTTAAAAGQKVRKSTARAAGVVAAVAGPTPVGVGAGVVAAALGGQPPPARAATPNRTVKPQPATTPTQSGKPVNGHTPVPPSDTPPPSPQPSLWKRATSGAPLTGASKALVPLASARNRITTARNRLLDRGAHAFNSGAGWTGTNHEPERVSVVDSTMRQAGKIAGAIDHAVTTFGQVAARHRTQAHRTTTVTTGSVTIDRLAAAKGMILRRADQAKARWDTPASAVAVTGRRLRIGAAQVVPRRAGGGQQ